MQYSKGLLYGRSVTGSNALVTTLPNLPAMPFSVISPFERPELKKAPANLETGREIKSLNRHLPKAFSYKNRSIPPSSGGAIGFDKGVLVCGYYHNLLEKMQPTPSWYSAALISRYVGEGEVYECKVGDSVYLSAIKRTDGEYTLVVTSYNKDDQTVKIDFAKALGGKTFYKYVYDPETVTVTEGADLIECSGSVEDVDTLLTDMVKSGTMVIYTTEQP